MKLLRSLLIGLTLICLSAVALISQLPTEMTMLSAQHLDVFAFVVLAVVLAAVVLVLAAGVRHRSSNLYMYHRPRAPYSDARSPG